MKKVAFLLAAAALLASCSQVRHEDAAQTEASLRSANAEYDQALLASDASALRRIYTDDFSFVGDRAELRNKDEQIRFMTDGSVELLNAASDQVSVTPLGHDHGLVTGRFSGRYRAGTEEADFIERYTSIWIRDGDRWRLRHEHSSLAPR